MRRPFLYHVKRFWCCAKRPTDVRHHMASSPNKTKLFIDNKFYSLSAKRGQQSIVQNGTSNRTQPNQKRSSSPSVLVWFFGNIGSESMLDAISCSAGEWEWELSMNIRQWFEGRGRKSGKENAFDMDTFRTRMECHSGMWQSQRSAECIWLLWQEPRGRMLCVQYPPGMKNVHECQDV